MPSTFIPDSDGFDYADGLDAHYYQNQVPPSGPLDDRSFEMAAARAKDKARHQLVKRVRVERQRVRDERGLSKVAEFGAMLQYGDASHVDVTMSVDGVPASSDDAIKL